jgi:transposase
VVGIDDWAITRGHPYGTIVVDLVRRRPIEVLDGRESTSVADWLQRHPSIQVLARDRAGAYSDAAQSVIPHAQQVADRWHLLTNLRETVERLLLRHNAKLREAAQLAIAGPSPPAKPSGIDSVLPLMAWQKLSNDRRAARFARYEEVVRLRSQGLTFSAIGQAMELDQRTVSNWAYARASSTDKVCRPGQRASTPSPQRAYAWLVGWDERGIQVPKRAEHSEFVQALCAIEPEIAEASSMAREFLGLIHRRDVDNFGRWLGRARDSKARELRRFAASIAADLSAVRAAFESPWSSGQVEGQINRLKFLKRQLYGRAKLDLLRARVLHPN